MFQYGLEGWAKLNDSTLRFSLNMRTLHLLVDRVIPVREYYLWAPYLQRRLPLSGPSLLALGGSGLSNS